MIGSLFKIQISLSVQYVVSLVPFRKCLYIFQYQNVRPIEVRVFHLLRCIVCMHIMKMYLETNFLLRCFQQFFQCSVATRRCF